MANTYSQVNIHCVFAVKGRENIISQALQKRLFEYISGILSSKNAYPLAVGGWKDHVHILFELPTDKNISEIVREVKASSTNWINSLGLIKGKFSWQAGYGAFSYAKSQRNNVINYILNQEQHHRVKTFKEEYLEMLQKFEIDFSEQFVFEFYDE